MQWHCITCPFGIGQRRKPSCSYMFYNRESVSMLSLASHVYEITIVFNRYSIIGGLVWYGILLTSKPHEFKSLQIGKIGEYHNIGGSKTIMPHCGYITTYHFLGNYPLEMKSWIPSGQDLDHRCQMASGERFSIVNTGWVRVPKRMITGNLQETNISHHGKRNIIFKSAGWERIWDGSLEGNW